MSTGHLTEISKASGLRTGIHTRGINRVDGTGKREIWCLG